MDSAFDIATVADFSGKARYRFEALALTFLASWVEFGAPMRGVLPLHLACIGEPPESVRRLAERAGAIVSVHEPLLLDGKPLTNKLRGFEVKAQHDRLLLVDTDVIFLGDMRPLGELPNGVAAAPADACKVPQRLWPRIYLGLGLDEPPHRIDMLGGELDLPPRPPRKLHFPEQDHELRNAYPYYNGGVVFAPVDCDLGTLWYQTVDRIAALFDPSEPIKGVHKSDQAGLAVSIQILRERGVPFHRLPDRFHARRRFFYAPDMDYDAFRLLHITGLHTKIDSADIAGAWRGEMRWLDRAYRRLFAMFRAGDVMRGRPLAGIRGYRRAARCRRRMFRTLDLLFERHICPVLDDAHD